MGGDGRPAPAPEPGPGRTPARKAGAIRGRGLARPAALALLVALGGCWRIGEPTPGEAHVTWAAYPETVSVGETFSFEFAGPVAPTACGRLDTATLAVTDSTIELEALRSTFDAMCADQRVSFYEVRPLSIERPGRYRVRSARGRELGTLVAVESGAFTPMRAIGEGTLEAAGGCLLFGPGWVGNQRPFALRGAPDTLRELVETDRVVGVAGPLIGFSSCSWYGSRPTIRVDSAWVTERGAADYYP